MFISDESPRAFFAPDYFVARERFLTLARSRNAKIKTHALDAAGPAGERLSIDTAYLGAERPRRLLVITSGTHGVEGFAGAALQQQWLHDFAPAWVPTDAGCLLIHALNPYGFAWLRRANEHNVDLNRNALAQFPGPANGAYRAFDAWLNPPTPPRFPDFFLARGAWLALRHGRAAMQQAIVLGQYEFPRGLFYGGERLETSTRFLCEILLDPAWRETERVTFLDVHTGVGKYATYKLMVDFAEDSETYRQMQRWFGAETVVSNRPADSLAYPVSGGLTLWIAALLAPRDVYACVLEFGTLSALRTLVRLRGENRAYQQVSATSAVLRRAQVALRDAFCPRDETWRRQMLEQGARVLEQAARACFS